MGLMIAIIDYGVRNLRSIENALSFVNPLLHIDIVHDADKLKKYSKIILPCVGAFSNGIRRMKKYHSDLSLFEEVKKKKYIYVCRSELALRFNNHCIVASIDSKINKKLKKL